MIDLHFQVWWSVQENWRKQRIAKKIKSESVGAPGTTVIMCI